LNFGLVPIKISGYANAHHVVKKILHGDIFTKCVDMIIFTNWRADIYSKIVLLYSILLSILINPSNYCTDNNYGRPDIRVS